MAFCYIWHFYMLSLFLTAMVVFRQIWSQNALVWPKKKNTRTKKNLADFWSKID